MTHTYTTRHGTTSLVASLDIPSGSVIAVHHRRHRHQKFLRFLTTELTTPQTAPLGSPQRHRTGSRHPQVDQRVER